MRKRISRSTVVLALFLGIALLVFVWLVASRPAGAPAAATPAPSPSSAAVVPTGVPSSGSSGSPAAVTAAPGDSGVPSDTGAPIATDSPSPSSAPTAAATVAPTPKPTPAPTPKPTPTPAPILAFQVAIDSAGGHAALTWTACMFPAGGGAYLVARSPDNAITYPLAGNDAAIDTVGQGGPPAYVDGAPPPGAADFYRIFCVDSGKHLLAESFPVVSFKRPVGVLTLTVTAKPTSNVLTWSACQTSHFNGYLIARSAASNLSLVPLVRGTVKAATIGAGGPHTWSETASPSLTKLYYRVQCTVDWEGKTILSAQSDARWVYSAVKS